MGAPRGQPAGRRIANGCYDGFHPSIRMQWHVEVGCPASGSSLEEGSGRDLPQDEVSQEIAAENQETTETKSRHKIEDNRSMVNIQSMRSSWTECESSSNHFGEKGRLLGIFYSGNTGVCACGCLGIVCFLFSL